MACNGAYADFWDYAAELCVHPILAGYDDSGGAGNPSLTNSTADFINGPDVEGGVGQAGDGRRRRPRDPRHE